MASHPKAADCKVRPIDEAGARWHTFGAHGVMLALPISAIIWAAIAALVL